jgi:hypothetical protein
MKQLFQRVRWCGGFATRASQNLSICLGRMFTFPLDRLVPQIWQDLGFRGETLA